MAGNLLQGADHEEIMYAIAGFEGAGGRNDVLVKGMRV